MFDANGKEIATIFQTATALDTPRLMTELVAWYQTEQKNPSLHPLLAIAVFVVDFTDILISRMFLAPFEVEISDDSAVRDAILADQVRSLDWKARQAKKKSKASNDIVEATLALIRTLID